MFASPIRHVLALICLGAALTAAELDREIVLAPHPGSAREDGDIRRWQERAGAKTATADDYTRLARAFIAKARRTQDAGYYKLAEKTTELLEARFGVSADSQLLRGHVLHNLHRFHEAEKIAGQLAKERGQPGDFALWSDTLLELGDLSGAVAACQKLVDARPGAEAYGRIAHLRWLKGDLPGATAAMEAAQRATGPGDRESRAWALTRLSGYYLQANRLDAALRAGQSAIGYVGEYAPAWFAQGRALLALQRHDEALAALRRAVTLNPLPESQWWLADALRGAGREPEATAVEAELRRRGGLADPRSLAVFLATRGQDMATAVRLAREELANRADVHTRDALAWALAGSGALESAAQEMQRALAEGTRDARLYLHAGEIARGRGKTREADEFFAAARSQAATLAPSEQQRLPAVAQAVAATSDSVFPAKL